MSEPRIETDRRTFLKLAGFSFAGGVISGCQPAKLEQAIPLLIKPEEVTPGVATWYATTCGGCPAACGVLAKNRDGRPIKLEGNPDHPMSRGGLCAAGQASILSLYDSQRLRQPLVNGAAATWNEVDRVVREKLSDARGGSKAVRLLSGTVHGPTTRGAIARFLGSFSDGRHVAYDALSASAILDAHAQTHGVRALPRFRFDRCDVIVSFDADFLGTWISPVEFTAAYRAGRTLEGTPPKFSYHVQIESHLSLTGSNADRRLAVSASGLTPMVHALARQIAFLAGERADRSDNAVVSELAARLWKARGRGLVVCGANDVATQRLVNGINHRLGNYGSTLDLEEGSQQRLGDDGALLALLNEIQAGKVGALIMHGCNPVYDLPEGAALAEWLKRIPLVISTADRLDESSSASTVVCPEPHYLESWSDAEPVAGIVSVQQPVIAPFGSTRTLAESLSAWSGEPKAMLDLVKEEWRRRVYPRSRRAGSFDDFWNSTVHDGAAEVSAVRTTIRIDWSAMAVGAPPPATPTATAGYELVTYATVGMFDGRNAHNPWLHELPDPVTKLVWGNAVSFAPATARSMNLIEGDVVRLETDGVAVELPVHIQPGQHERVVSVPVGFGRMGTDRFSTVGPRWVEAAPTVEEGGVIGANIARFHRRVSGAVSNVVTVTLNATGERRELACTQVHHSLHVPEHLAPASGERRPIIQETSLAAYAHDPSTGHFGSHDLTTLWPDDHVYDGHRWGMVIDLTACTGCSACVVGCMAENNIPVVGRDEVSRSREMTWLRIDRYYTEEADGVSVAHQPMMCQHCEHAPCETVCPVLATVHSSEGLNQQVYNRCVGTRYCSNNCPYKVRRFNWFQYSHGDDMSALVLNPDITVRERGVMEKCSFCIQRIHAGKIAAKQNGVALRDGDIRPACEQSCPAGAIVFGDMNDPDSAIARRMKDPRTYRVLDEIGVRPSVGYMTLVRNRDVQGGSHHG